MDLSSQAISAISTVAASPFSMPGRAMKRASCQKVKACSAQASAPAAAAPAIQASAPSTKAGAGGQRTVTRPQALR